MNNIIKNKHFDIINPFKLKKYVWNNNIKLEILDPMNNLIYFTEESEKLVVFNADIEGIYTFIFTNLVILLN